MIISFISLRFDSICYLIIFINFDQKKNFQFVTVSETQWLFDG